jgi:hypothetical protein
MPNAKYEIGTDIMDVFGGSGRIIKIWPSLEHYYRDFGKRFPDKNWRRTMTRWFNQLAIRPQKGLDQFWYGIDIGFPSREEASKLDGVNGVIPEEFISILENNTNLGPRRGFQIYKRENHPW